jgi:hypothetical protein
MQQGIVKGEVEAHLIRHYREMEWYEESNISEDEIEHSESDDLVKMEEDHNEDELAHHGVKGQRWGILRYRGSDGRVVPGRYISKGKAEKIREEGGGIPTLSSPTATPQATPPPTSTESPTGGMTDAELKNVIARLQLEKQYKELTATPKSEQPATPKPDTKTETKGDARKMSDAALKASIDRLQMEHKFKELSKPEVSRGKKIMQGILREVGTTIQRDLIDAFSANILKPMLDEKLSGDVPKRQKATEKQMRENQNLATIFRNMQAAHKELNTFAKANPTNQAAQDAAKSALDALTEAAAEVTRRR